MGWTNLISVGKLTVGMVFITLFLSLSLSISSLWFSSVSTQINIIFLKFSMQKKGTFFLNFNYIYILIRMIRTVTLAICLWTEYVPLWFITIWQEVHHSQTTLKTDLDHFDANPDPRCYFNERNTFMLIKKLVWHRCQL